MELLKLDWHEPKIVSFKSTFWAGTETSAEGPLLAEIENLVN